MDTARNGVVLACQFLKDNTYIFSSSNLCLLGYRCSYQQQGNALNTYVMSIQSVITYSSPVRVRSRCVFFGNLRLEKNPFFLVFKKSYMVYTGLKNLKNVPNNEKVNNCRLQSHLKKLANSTLYESSVK